MRFCHRQSKNWPKSKNGQSRIRSSEYLGAREASFFVLQSLLIRQQHRFMGNRNGEEDEAASVDEGRRAHPKDARKPINAAGANRRQSVRRHRNSPLLEFPAAG
jgi:hypothetical protein